MIPTLQLGQMGLASAKPAADPTVPVKLRFEQANGATTTVDEGFGASVWTFSAGASISTSAPLSESASLLLAAGTDYIETDWTTTIAPTTTQSFCIEYRLTPLVSQAGHLMMGVTVTDTGPYVFGFYFAVTTALPYFYWRGADGVDRNIGATSTTGSPPHHIAASWDGTTWRLFYNGALVASLVNSSGLGFTASRKLRIGKIQYTGETGVNSKFDNVRVTIGDARYTAAFTPPTTI